MKIKIIVIVSALLICFNNMSVLGYNNIESKDTSKSSIERVAPVQIDNYYNALCVFDNGNTATAVLNI